MAGSALSRLHSWSTGRECLSIPIESDQLNFFSAGDSGQPHGPHREVAGREGTLADHPYSVVLGCRVGPAPVDVADLVGGVRAALPPLRRPVPPLPDGHRE